MDILFEDKNLKKSTNEGPVAQIVWANERTAKMLEIVDYHG